MIDYRKSHSCFKTFFTDPKNLPGILCINVVVRANNNSTAVVLMMEWKDGNNNNSSNNNICNCNTITRNKNINNILLGL